jgi:uncharacterized protein YjdB
VVPGPAASISVTPLIATVKNKKTIQLTAAAVDAKGNVISGRAFAWSSSGPNYATVDQKGLVTGKKATPILFAVQISAQMDGKSGSSLVTVTP